MIKTIGVIGGGQLGRMLALAGIPLGFRFCFLDPSPVAPAAELGRHIPAPYDDPAGLQELGFLSDVVTYEFENVPVTRLHVLGQKLQPGVRPLEVSQDRLVEKEFFAGLNIPTAPYKAVGSGPEVAEAFAALGPGILKTRRLGYDGKGQVQLSTPADTSTAWEAIGGVPAVYEGLVNFDREVSIIAVRGADGQTVCYPLIQNFHRGGILRRSMAPVEDLPDPVQHQAQTMVSKVMEKFNYVGVLTIELFLLPDQTLVVNEMAPRVHNSGHLTIEAAITSQFENHVRALAGLPLGSTQFRQSATMLNCIGTMPAARPILVNQDVHYHHYGKANRPGRKVGHVTICGINPQLLDQLAYDLEGSGVGEASARN